MNNNSQVGTGTIHKYLGRFAYGLLQGLIVLTLVMGGIDELAARSRARVMSRSRNIPEVAAPLASESTFSDRGFGRQGPTTVSTTQEHRVALVIGNSNYVAVPALRNPANDAEDMASALRELGFEVDLHVDVPDLQTMREIIDQFANKLSSGGVGLFYYAGHGLQISGENYLVPIKAKTETEDDVKYDMYAMSDVQKKMGDAHEGVDIIILDACRNNPLSRSIRRSSSARDLSPTIGLAQMRSVSGSFITFATSPGDTAADGNDRNGTYTKHILANIRTPGLDVEAVFKKVRKGVMQDTHKEQKPWESSSLTDSFCFAGCENNGDELRKAQAAAAAAEQRRIEAEQALKDAKEQADSDAMNRTSSIEEENAKLRREAQEREERLARAENEAAAARAAQDEAIQAARDSTEHQQENRHSFSFFGVESSEKPRRVIQLPPAM